MTNDEMNKGEHSCCEVPAGEVAPDCKECGNKGKSVKETTLRSLVKERNLGEIKSFDGFYFCETPSCKVVYFNNKQQIYLYKEDVKVRVGIKETEDPVPVCYCFGWTQEKIFNQIKQLGSSTAVQEISAKVKAGKCTCDINNPSGKCCLGQVNKVVKKGMEIYGKGTGNNKQEGNLRNFPLVCSIISAVVASICCLGPVALAILGVSGAGLFSKFAELRPYFIGITLVLLGLAFYLSYRKREVICEDGTCKIKSVRKWNKIILWVATGFIAFFIAFPYLNLSSQNPLSERKGKEIVEVTIPVEGMTCFGCEFNVESAVKKLNGISQAKADHQKGKVHVKFEIGQVTVDRILEVIDKAGYKATKP